MSKLYGVGFLGGLLIAAASANEAMLDKLGLFGTFAFCMVWIAVSAFCAARLGAMDFGKEELFDEVVNGGCAQDEQHGKAQSVSCDLEGLECMDHRAGTGHVG